MNFYALVGSRRNQSVLNLTLDNDAQAELSSMFERVLEDVSAMDQVKFDPNYRADENEIVTVSPYNLPTSVSPLLSSEDAAALPPLKAEDIENASLRAIAAVEWNGTRPSFVAFQRIESRYVLKRETWRLMLARGRFVRDDRPGLEIAERIDAVVRDATLYVVSWSRAHAILDLSPWTREATISEMQDFFQHRKLALGNGFDPEAIADSVVRRKITSIGASKVLEQCSVQSLQKYASKFGVSLTVSKGKIVLPSTKKDFKAVLGLLDEDLLAFEPTNEHWVVNSKRRATPRATQ